MNRMIMSLLILLYCCFNTQAASITNDLSSTSLGFWIGGGSNGSPVGAPSGYTDPNYVVANAGVSTFRWETLDGQDDTGTVQFWIYDEGAVTQNVSTGAPSQGPHWGLRSGTSSHSLVVGNFRYAFTAWHQGYSPWSTAAPFNAYWFKDGVRASVGVAWSPGWFKWTLAGTYNSISVTLHDVNYNLVDGPPHDDTVFGDVLRTYNMNSFGGLWFDVFGFGWNSIVFKGDGAGGPEDMYLAVVGGTGVFAGVGGGGSVGQTSPVTFSPGAQYFINSVSVTLSSSTNNANIYFTLNGTNPDSTSIPYNNPLVLGSTTTIKARAYSAGSTPSNVTSATYTKNIAPQITSNPPTDSVFALSLYTYNVAATDLNGDQLTYSLITKPAGMSIGSGSGVIQWTPAGSQVGTKNVSVEVDDGKGGTDRQNFAITVYDLPVTNPPVVIMVEDTGSYNYTSVTITIVSLAGSDSISVSVAIDTTPPLLPPNVKTLSKFYTITEGAAITSFNASLAFTYTDAEFNASGIDDEANLICLRYNGVAWQAVPSTVDAVNNIVSCNTDEFSLWALVESRVTPINTEKETIGPSVAYINPFGIKVPVSENLQLRLFKTDGSQIQSHERMFTPGIHSLEMGNNLPAGIYVLTISGTNTRLVQKVVVTK